MASKCSRANPSGLIMPWHVWHASSFGLQGNTLASRQIRVQLGRQRRDRLRRRLQRAPQHATRDEHAAVDRRARARVGKVRQYIRMRNHAGPLIRPERDLLKRRIVRQFDIVNARQPAVEIDRVGRQQLTKVGRFAVEQLVDRKFQRGAQIGSHLRREFRKRSRSFAISGAWLTFSQSSRKSRNFARVRKSGSIR